MAACIAGTRLKCEVRTRMPKTFQDDLYIVVCPQMFKTLPPNDRTIMFQMEQGRVSHWFNPEYIRKLNSSLGVLDYSVENIRFLRENGLEMRQLYHVPIRPVALRPATDATQNPAARDIDVLFYGAINSDRRRKYLDALSKNFNLRVESNIFGDELRALLRRAKVVVNVHFYEDALLETTRISEALSLGARVVSESAVDQIRQMDFESVVTFVPSDDVDAFIDQVKDTLALSEYPPDSQSIPEFSVPSLGDNSFWGMRFMLLRALHGIGILSFEELELASAGLSLQSQTCMLCLPEDLVRYDFGGKNLLPGAALFPGLRNIVGWKGCAESYKFMASRALEGRIWPLTIYEDDAEFQTDSLSRILKVREYLAAFPGHWDIFSGLLSDLSEDTNVISVEEVFGERFAVLDTVIGMVFGIYNENALHLMADFVFEGNDTSSHTIDRFLEKQGLVCITTARPIVGHAEGIGSTIWPVGNILSAPVIAQSIDRLGEKIASNLERKAFQERSS